MVMNVPCPYTNYIFVYKVFRTHGKHKRYTADFINEELICPTARLEWFHKKAKRTAEALENSTLNWQTAFPGKLHSCAQVLLMLLKHGFLTHLKTCK